MDTNISTYFSYYYVNVDKVEKPVSTRWRSASTSLTCCSTRQWRHRPAQWRRPTVSRRVSTRHAEGRRHGDGPVQVHRMAVGHLDDLAPNDDFWDATLQPMVKTLELRFIADESTAANGLGGGEIDGMYYYLPPAALSQLKDAPECDVYFGRSLVFWSLLTLAKGSPFADPRVIQALLLATDRDAIAKVVFQGTATPARVVSPPSSWSYAKDIYQAAYDAIPGKRWTSRRPSSLLRKLGPRARPSPSPRRAARSFTVRRPTSSRRTPLTWHQHRDQGHPRAALREPVLGPGGAGRDRRVPLDLVRQRRRSSRPLCSHRPRRAQQLQRLEPAGGES